MYYSIALRPIHFSKSMMFGLILFNYLYNIGQIKHMDGPSQVLLKDFLSSSKTTKTKTTSAHTAYVSRINTQHLAKEINKSKLIIGAQLTHPNAFKSNPNFLKSEPYLDKSSKSALHSKKKGNSIYIRLEHKKMNKEARTEFIDRTIKNEYQATMPVIKKEREDKKAVQTVNSSRNHHFNSFHEQVNSDRSEYSQQKISGLKVNFYFLKKMERCQSQARHNRKKNKETKVDKEKPFKSNLMNPEELKQRIGSGRTQMRAKIEKRLQGLQFRHLSYAEKIAQMLTLEEQSGNPKCNQDGNADPPSEFTSGGILFHRKTYPRKQCLTSPHKQFLVKVKKLHCQSRRVHENTNRKYELRHQSEQQESSPHRSKTPLFKRKRPTVPMSPMENAKRHNTDYFKSKANKLSDLEDESILPW